ncbi:MAG: DUF2147 domain-containing protein, partial [Hyphomicrobiaceae bacterium]
MSILFKSVIRICIPFVVVWFTASVGLTQVGHARSDIRGVWINHTGKGAVELRRCGKKNGICGYIVWLRKPIKASGEPFRDALNPNPTKRKRPICGLEVVRGLTPLPGGSWD